MNRKKASDMSELGIYESKTKLADLNYHVKKDEAIPITNRCVQVADLVLSASWTFWQTQDVITAIKTVQARTSINQLKHDKL